MEVSSKVGLFALAVSTLLGTPRNEGSAPSWSLAIATTTPVVAKWQGVVLELRAQNLSDVAQTLRQPMLAGGSDKQEVLRVTDPSGAVKDVFAAVATFSVLEAGDVVEVARDEEHTELFLAAFDWARDKPLFDAPGQYKVQVLVGTAASNVLTVTCVPTPQAATNSFAAVLALQQQKRLDVLYSGYFLMPTGHEALVAQLESLALAPGGGWCKEYAAFSLGVASVCNAKGALELSSVPALAAEARTWFSHIAPSSALAPFVVRELKTLIAVEKKAAAGH